MCKEFNNLNNEETERLHVLYEDAVNFYLDSTDFNPIEWLTGNDAEEYKNLVSKAEIE